MTFDDWNTLCCEPPGGYLRGRRLEAMSQVLVDAGVGSAGVVLPVLTGDALERSPRPRKRNTSR